VPGRVARPGPILPQLSAILHLVLISYQGPMIVMLVSLTAVPLPVSTVTTTGQVPAGIDESTVQVQEILPPQSDSSACGPAGKTGPEEVLIAKLAASPGLVLTVSCAVSPGLTGDVMERMSSTVSPMGAGAGWTGGCGAGWTGGGVGWRGAGGRGAG
jgi:hypothetical protein